MESFFARGRVNAIVGGTYELVTEAEFVVLSGFHVVHHGHWAGEEGERKAKHFASSLGFGAQAVKVPKFWYCAKVGVMAAHEAQAAKAAYAVCKTALQEGA